MNVTILSIGASKKEMPHAGSPEQFAHVAEQYPFIIFTQVDGGVL